MTSPIGMIKDKANAFTLVELILVMVLLTTLAALVAPRLTGMLRGRELDQQATALLAATEYARSEAISQGVPMTFWVNEERFGVRAQSGGEDRRERQWMLARDVQFEEVPESENGIATFQPDGTLDIESADKLTLVHRDGAKVAVVKKDNGYRIEK